MSALFHPKVLLLEGLLLIGGFAAQKALAQQPIIPAKAPADTVKVQDTRTLSPRGKLMFLVEVMVFAINKAGPEKALAGLKIENKQLGVSEEVTQAIFEITYRNLKNGVTDISSITDEVETRVKVKITPVNPNETIQDSLNDTTKTLNSPDPTKPQP